MLIYQSVPVILMVLTVLPRFRFLPRKLGTPGSDSSSDVVTEERRTFRRRPDPGDAGSGQERCRRRQPSSRLVLVLVPVPSGPAHGKKQQHVNHVNAPVPRAVRWSLSRLRSPPRPLCYRHVDSGGCRMTSTSSSTEVSRWAPSRSGRGTRTRCLSPQNSHTGFVWKKSLERSAPSALV